MSVTRKGEELPNHFFHNKSATKSVRASNRRSSSGIIT